MARLFKRTLPLTLTTVTNCTPSSLFMKKRKRERTKHFIITNKTSMASTFSSSSSSSSGPFTVTQELFKQFHNIDRILFTKLLNLGRSPMECMQVIALWIWIEQSGQCRDLVNTMLTWPDTIISSLADEAVLCLFCMESDESFPFSLQNIEIPLTQSITKSRVSLSFFRDNRLKILHGVSKNVSEVCIRAFDDLVPQNNENYSGNDIMKQRSDDYGAILPVTSHNLFSQYFQGFDPYDLAVQRQPEIDEMMRRMQISGSNSEQGNELIIIPPDERTIFLTFSKGYPISENKIRDFFIRKFGECFETIHMQEVPSTEQPLYARLVANSASFMDMILQGKSKAKFSIYGKHVWARKYVRKVHRSPPKPSSPSQPAVEKTIRVITK